MIWATHSFPPLRSGRRNTEPDPRRRTFPLRWPRLLGCSCSLVFFSSVMMIPLSGEQFVCTKREKPHVSVRCLAQEGEGRCLFPHLKQEVTRNACTLLLD